MGWWKFWQKKTVQQKFEATQPNGIPPEAQILEALGFALNKHPQAIVPGFQTLQWQTVALYFFRSSIDRFCPSGGHFFLTEVDQCPMCKVGARAIVIEEQIAEQLGRAVPSKETKEACGGIQ